VFSLSLRRKCSLDLVPRAYFFHYCACDSSCVLFRKILMSRLWLFGGDDVYVKGKRRLLSGSEIAAILKTALVKNGQEMSQDPKARKEPRKLEIKNKGIHNSLAE
jgi:hypothetical protein